MAFLGVNFILQKFCSCKKKWQISGMDEYIIQDVSPGTNQMIYDISWYIIGGNGEND